MQKAVVLLLEITDVDAQPDEPAMKVRCVFYPDVEHHIPVVGPLEKATIASLPAPVEHQGGLPAGEPRPDRIVLRSGQVRDLEAHCLSVELAAALDIRHVQERGDPDDRHDPTLSAPGLTAPKGRLRSGVPLEETSAADEALRGLSEGRQGF